MYEEVLFDSLKEWKENIGLAGISLASYFTPLLVSFAFFLLFVLFGGAGYFLLKGTGVEVFFIIFVSLVGSLVLFALLLFLSGFFSAWLFISAKKIVLEKGFDLEETFSLARKKWFRFLKMQLGFTIVTVAAILIVSAPFVLLTVFLALKEFFLISIASAIIFIASALVSFAVFVIASIFMGLYFFLGLPAVAFTDKTFKQVLCYLKELLSWELVFFWLLIIGVNIAVGVGVSVVSLPLTLASIVFPPIQIVSRILSLIVVLVFQVPFGAIYISRVYFEVSESSS